MDFPDAVLKGRYKPRAGNQKRTSIAQSLLLTLSWALEAHVKLVHAVVDQIDLIVGHQQLHDVRIGATLGGAKRVQG